MKIENTTIEQIDKINQRLQELKEQEDPEFATITFDTETTGFINLRNGKNQSRMTEFGAVITVNGKPLTDKEGNDISQIQIYFNPWLENKKLKQSFQAYEVHGIDEDFLNGVKSLGGNTKIYLDNPALTIETYLDSLSDLLSQNIVKTHNGQTFDLPFFNHELKRYNLPMLGKIAINLDTQRIFQKELKDIKEKYPELIESIGWVESFKLTVDNEPNKGLIPFIEKVSGEKCDIERNLHGALLDSLILEWAASRMFELKHPETKEYLFPEFRKQYNSIKQVLAKSKRKEVTEEKNENNNETDVFVKFYSNKTTPYAQDPYLQGSVDIERMFEKASELGYKEITIMDHQRPNQNPLSRDIAKGYENIKINYGTTVYLNVNGENILIDLVSRNGQEYGEMMDLITKASKNNFEKPYLTLEDLENKKILKSVTHVNNNLNDLEVLKSKGFKFDISNNEDFNFYKSQNLAGTDLIKKSEVFYVEKKDKVKQEMRIKSQINKEGVLNENIEDKIKNKYLLSPSNVNNNFSEINEDTYKIETNFILPEHRDIFPDYYVEPQYQNAFEEFVDKSNKGLELRFIEDSITDKSEQKEYKERLKEEQEIIKEMLIDSVKNKEEGITFDVIKFDEYLLGMANKIDAVKNITNILVDKYNTKNKMLVGNARGSAAGSLAAYSMKIIEVDPMKYDLLFERFLNPERVSVPDIDSDFAGTINIEELNISEINEQYPHLYDFIKYKSNTKYEGETIFETKTFVSEYYEWYRSTENGTKPVNYEEIGTGGVLTLGYYKAKTALSDMAKIYGDEIAQMVGFKTSVELADYLKNFVGNSVEESNRSIEEVLENSEEFNLAYKNNPIIQNIVNDAKEIEGTVKSEGIHPGAVVSKAKKIEGILTTAIILNKKGQSIAPFTMKNVEVMKDDILGLKTLETIENTIDMINETNNSSKKDSKIFSNKMKKLTSKKFDLEEGELQKILTLLKEGKNNGLFQIESDGMTDLFTEVFNSFTSETEPKNYTELVQVISLLLALYRPGPMESGMLARYLSNIKGETEIEVPLNDPEIGNLLKETSGVIAYQEQVMKIVQIAGGFSLGEADIIRRAMGKKDMKTMEEFQKKFVEGGLKKGHKEEELVALFDNIQKFAGYGFNKSHSVSYAEITLQTLHLKANNGIFFNISILNNKIDGKSEDFSPVMAKVRGEGYEINTPNIFDVKNYSVKFGVRDNEERSINYGFQFIVGENKALLIEEIIKTQDIKNRLENGSMTQEEWRTILFDNLDKGSVEKIIKSGTLRIGNETLSEVNEKYYNYKNNGKTQLDTVKEFLLKDKVAFAKGFDNVIKKVSPTWKKSSFLKLLEDKDIENHLKSIKKYDAFLIVMNGVEKDGEITKGKIDTVKFFPETDFEIWLTEQKTICMENTVDHPLTSKELHNYERKNKIEHLNTKIDDINNKIKEDKDNGSYEDGKMKDKIKIVGVCSGLNQIVTKKGEPMYIGDIVTESGKAITILISGESFASIKKGENIDNNQIIEISGVLGHTDEKGLSIFVDKSKIVDLNQNNNKEKTKTNSTPAMDLSGYLNENDTDKYIYINLLNNKFDKKELELINQNLAEVLGVWNNGKAKFSLNKNNSIAVKKWGGEESQIKKINTIISEIVEGKENSDITMKKLEEQKEEEDSKIVKNAEVYETLKNIIVKNKEKQTDSLWSLDNDNCLIFNSWPNAGESFYKTQPLTKDQIDGIISGDISTLDNIEAKLMNGKKEMSALLNGEIINISVEGYTLTLDKFQVQGNDNLLTFNFDRSEGLYVCKELNAKIKLTDKEITKMIKVLKNHLKTGNTDNLTVNDIIGDKLFTTSTGEEKSQENKQINPIVGQDSVNKHETLLDICPHGKIRNNCNICNKKENKKKENIININ